MFRQCLDHFRQFRIQKIDYLLRPERQAVRGCFYFFAKFFVTCIAVQLVYTPVSALLAPFMNADGFVSAVPFLILTFLSLPFVILVPVFAINQLDTFWRKREKAQSDQYEIEIRDILTQYLGSGALNDYNKEVVERILRQEGDLNECLQEMSGKQLALIEDAILYTFEMRGISHAHAYGTKLLIFALMVTFMLGFVPLATGLDYVIRHYIPALQKSIILIFPFIGVAMVAMTFAMRDVQGYWNRMGPHLRNGARNLLFYWPVTFIALCFGYVGVYALYLK